MYIYTCSQINKVNVYMHMQYLKQNKQKPQNFIESQKPNVIYPPVLFSQGYALSCLLTTILNICPQKTSLGFKAQFITLISIFLSPEMTGVLLYYPSFQYFLVTYLSDLMTFTLNRLYGIPIS